MSFDPVSWPSIRLVVFDLDGTLYRQRPVQIGMAMALLGHALGGGWRDVQAVRQFRALREAGGVPDGEDFEHRCLAEASRRTGMPAPRIAELVREWMEIRPLPRLRPARYAHVAELFAALRRSERKIAVWSDHPVDAKLAALELTAEYCIAATDPALRRLKPDPAGLELLMARAGVPPQATLMIGDRIDRDGEAARRAGTQVAIRSARPLNGFTTFASFDDAIFAPVLH